MIGGLDSAIVFVVCAGKIGFWIWPKQFDMSGVSWNAVAFQWFLEEGNRGLWLVTDCDVWFQYN